MTDLKGTTITWLGHATVLVQTAAGTTVLIDPFLTGNPSYPASYTLPEKIDLILATHAHGDHIADVIPIAKKTGAKVVAMVELAGYFTSKGVEDAVGINLGGSFTFHDVTASMTEAHHSSSIEEDGKFLYAGEPAGFVLTIKDGPVLYHAGDTSVFAGMELIGQLWQPTLGMLPMGGHYTMDPKGAALAAKLLKLDTVLPIHWGTFPVLTGTPQQLEQHLEGTGITVLYTEPGKPIQ